MLPGRPRADAAAGWCRRCWGRAKSGWCSTPTSRASPRVRLVIDFVTETIRERGDRCCAASEERRAGRDRGLQNREAEFRPTRREDGYAVRGSGRQRHRGPFLRALVRGKGSAEAPRHQPHDGEGEVGVVADELVEGGLVDDGELGRTDRDRRGASRLGIDQRHLAEDLAPRHCLDDAAALADLDLAAPHHVGGVAAVALDEDDAAIAES